MQVLGFSSRRRPGSTRPVDRAAIEFLDRDALAALQ